MIFLCTSCPTCSPSKIQPAPPAGAPASHHPCCQQPLVEITAVTPTLAPFLAHFLRALPSSRRDPSKSELCSIPHRSEPHCGSLLADGRSQHPSHSLQVLCHLPCHLSDPVPITLLRVPQPQPPPRTVGKLPSHPSCHVTYNTLRTAREGSWPQSTDEETEAERPAGLPRIPDMELRPGAGVLGPHNPPCLWPLASVTPNPLR